MVEDRTVLRVSFTVNPLTQCVFNVAGGTVSGITEGMAFGAALTELRLGWTFEHSYVEGECVTNDEPYISGGVVYFQRHSYYKILVHTEK